MQSDDAKLKLHLLNVVKALGNLLFGGRRFIFNEVPFHACLFGRFQNGWNGFLRLADSLVLPRAKVRR